MVKDKRYHALKAYIDSGAAKSFAEIFDIVPKTRFVTDTGINYTRLTNKINNPEKFTVKDILLIAQLIEIDSTRLYGLIAAAVHKKVLKKK